MKFEAGVPSFTPVTITLESQEEIDQIYAIAIASKENHSLIKGLRPYRTFSGYHKFHTKIRKKSLYNKPRCRCGRGR